MVMSDFVDDPALAAELGAADPTDADVSSIAALARRAKQLEGEVADATAALRAKLTEYHQIVGHDLPNALRQAGVAGLPLADGTPVALRTTFDGSKLTSAEGLRWVEENGGSSLIKTQLVLEMDRGDLEAAREILTELRGNRHANKYKVLTLREEVNPQTIAKFARELIDQRKDPPLQLLGVRRRSYATVGDRPQTVDLKGFVRR
jgi:nucleotide-binding universal stress UspA family protein